MELVLYPERICLYCGEEMEEELHGYESVYECNCKDVIEVIRIQDEIKKLTYAMPQPKFKRVQVIAIHKLKED